MRVIESDRVLTVDCDDTLVLWDKSQFPESEWFEMDCWGPVQLVKHHRNIKLLRKFALLGYTVIVWSQTGAKWAEAVGKAVGIDDVVTLYMAKPRYYMDDLPCEKWMGERVWRNPKGPEKDPYAIQD